MSMGGRSQSQTIEDILTKITYDLNSIDTFDQALENVPTGSRVAITLNPDNGVEPTIDRAIDAANRDYHVIPHLGARFIRETADLETMLSRLESAGISEIFVIGGDRDEPIGEFDSALELLVAIEELGYTFPEVGIGGYPTGHESISDATLIAGLQKKAEYASYIVTQLSFSSEDILQWVERIRDAGISLPVEVGIPGVMYYWRLISLCRMWGIAKPLQFLRKTTGIAGFASELIRSRGKFHPTDLVYELDEYFDNDFYNLRRFRFYTFNQTADFEQWRNEQLPA
jgi:methylenetetrahydrofolate reductase (NADPH)